MMLYYEWWEIQSKMKINIGIFCSNSILPAKREIIIKEMTSYRLKSFQTSDITDLDSGLNSRSTNKMMMAAIILRPQYKYMAGLE